MARLVRTDTIGALERDREGEYKEQTLTGTCELSLLVLGNFHQGEVIWMEESWK